LNPLPNGLDLLTSMITPAVLISACGTLIFSTSTRLARVVDRVRELSHSMEALFRGEVADFPTERREEMEHQLAFYVRRSRLIQRSLTAYYVSLGLFVAATIAIGLTAFLRGLSFLPALLGIAGTAYTFYGCVLLIREMRLSQRSVDSEMEFILRLGALYQARHGLAPEQPPPAELDTWDRLRTIFLRGGESDGKD
jgi:hypothetical protein